MFNLITDIHIRVKTGYLLTSVTCPFSQAQGPTHRGHVFFKFLLTSCSKLLVDCRFQFMFFSHMALPKVNYRFVDFFAMV